MTPRPTQYLSCKFVATGNGIVIGVTQFSHVTSRKAGPCLFKQIFGLALLMGTVKKKKIGCLFKILNLFDFARLRTILKSVFGTCIFENFKDVELS